MKAIDGLGAYNAKITIENGQEAVRVDEAILEIIVKTAEACLGHEAFRLPCEIDITLTDNEGIREINRQHRSIDRATDVLSFPMVEMVNGKIISSEGDTDMEEGLLLLGDIVISLEKAQAQAEEYGHSFERETAFLTSHGVFHLLGYDHPEEEQEREMIGRQEAVLEKLGLKRK